MDISVIKKREWSGNIETPDLGLCPKCNSKSCLIVSAAGTDVVQWFCTNCRAIVLTEEIKEEEKLYSWNDYEEQIPIKKIIHEPPKGIRKNLIQKWAPVLENDEARRKWEIENPEELFTWRDYENNE